VVTGTYVLGRLLRGIARSATAADAGDGRLERR
jgi:hypothetical protein